MPGYYSEELISEISSSNDIVDVISEYVKLKRSGRNYLGICPFHSEKTPSFSVSPEKQIFHCFGCGVGGNVIHFIMKIENLDFVESIKLLAEKAKIFLPEVISSKFETDKQKLKEKIYEINKESAKYFFNVLKSTKLSFLLEYLKRRGLTPDMVNKFGIGYSQNTSDSLCNYLLSLNYSPDLIVQSGVGYKDKNNRLHDKFRNRLMFPIIDVRDRVIGFGGRVLDNSLPKYINSPETLVYSKGKNLYALNLAKKTNEKFVIVVEGYMDAITLHNLGITNVVAALGTSFTVEQVRLLRKYFSEIIVSFDSDSAGQNAIMRSLDLLNEMEMPVRVIDLGDKKDPDEFVKDYGVNSFKTAINTSRSLAEYKVEMLKKQYDLNDTREKINFVNKMSQVLANLKNSIERDAYIKKISSETNISTEAIYSEVNKIFYKNQKLIKQPKITIQKTIKPQYKDEKEDIKTLNAEKMLIALLCNSVNKEVIFSLKENIKTDDLVNETNKKIVEKIYELVDNNKSVDYSNVLSVLNSEEEISAFTEIIQRENSFESPDKLATDIISNIERKKLERRKNTIIEKLKNAELNESEIQTLNQDLKDIMSIFATLKKN